jgi:predicted alpha/beta-fold hydrolase
MNYPAPAWLPNGHLQTIYPALCIRKPAVQFRRERWSSPDHDFIDLDFIDGAAEQPCVVLFHGLEGSSDSHYARALMALLKSKNWSGVVVHFRGCSGELNRAPRFYHSGDAQEIGWILQRLQSEYAIKHPKAKFFACGVSLGGNALLRWLGETQQAAGIVDAACAISAPLDLAAGGASLSSGINLIYTRMFLQSLKPKCLKKLEQFPGLFDKDAMLQAKNLYEFDNVVTAPLHGYRDTNDYWDRASAKHILEQIRVPTLVLNAQNDPFLPARYLPSKASSQVRLEYPQCGGHVGFAVGSLPGKLDWLPKRILHFFEGK